MWVLDKVEQAIFWSDEVLFDPEVQNFEDEDEDRWSDSSEHEPWDGDVDHWQWETMQEDAAMEGNLFGWDA